jgi:hypothetical protein
MEPFDIDELIGQENPTPYFLYGDKYPPKVLYQGPRSESKDRHTETSDVTNAGLCSEVVLEDELDSNLAAASSGLKLSSKVQLLALILPRKSREEFLGDLLEWRSSKVDQFNQTLKTSRRVIVFTVNVITICRYCVQLIHLLKADVYLALEKVIDSVESILNEFSDFLDRHIDK